MDLPTGDDAEGLPEALSFFFFVFSFWVLVKGIYFKLPYITDSILFPIDPYYGKSLMKDLVFLELLACCRMVALVEVSSSTGFRV